MSEPVARGVLVAQPDRHPEEMASFAKECVGILRALRAEATVAATVPPEADFVLLLVEEGWRPDRLELPDMTDRAGAAAGVAEVAAEGRVAVTAARKRLRAANATLGSRELVFAPSRFGILGLESDGDRERLEILLRLLVLDAERLRLRREGWEEPEEEGYRKPFSG